MKILIATHNKNKIKEFTEKFSPYGIEVLNDEKIVFPEVVEDKDSFCGNALKKALETAQYCQVPVVADDSGLEVEALNFEPGIYSARYAPTSEERINKILKKLKGESNRRANFTCALAFATPKGWSACVEGKVWGKISNQIMGEGGFGYDPIFIADGYDKSFAQIGLEEKNKISHRHNAFEQALKQDLFNQLLSNE